MSQCLIGLPAKGGFACFSKLIYNFTMQAYDSHATPIVRLQFVADPANTRGKRFSTSY